jgi:hypothetical protein
MNNNQKIMVLIHSFKYGYGLGDMFRSMIAFFVVCKQNNIEYFLDFSETPLKYCFNNVIGPKYVGYKHFSIKEIRISSLIDVKTALEMKQFVEYIISNKDKTIVIQSNEFDFLPMQVINEHTKDFLDFLKVSDSVKSRMKEILDSNGLKEHEFNAVHVRCGDAFMTNKKVHGDSRISPNSAVNKVIKAVDFLRLNDKDLPIILFTDNELLRKRSIIMNTQIIDTHIVHTAMQSSEEIDKLGAIDAVAEFLLLGQSKNVMAIKHSGFSFWPTFFYNVPLYQLDDSDNIYLFDKMKLKYNTKSIKNN